MLLTGSSIVARQIVRNLRSVQQQRQPCGVDLTLWKVFTWSTPAILDFDNARREAAQTSELPFRIRRYHRLPTPAGDDSKTSKTGITTTTTTAAAAAAKEDVETVANHRLAQGTYLVEFGETVHIPRDCVGQIFPRSSLWRSGATLTAGLIDAGYEDALGALLDVRNPNGLELYRFAKLGQLAVHRLNEEVDEPYNGIYQFATSTVGRDGPPPQSTPAGAKPLQEKTQKEGKD